MFFFVTEKENRRYIFLLMICIQILQVQITFEIVCTHYFAFFAKSFTFREKVCSCEKRKTLNVEPISE